VIVQPAFAAADAAAPEPATSAPAGTAPLQLEDIVVTALRRNTELLRTPLAVTALTGEQLQMRGITSPTQLNQEVPNLVINRSNAGLIQATIRGVSSQDITEKGDSSVGFLFDGIYIGRAQALDVGMFDLDRVEVLRGPQGTLFGRNTTAGVINFVPNHPRDKLGAGATLTVGNYNLVQVEGYLNVPVSDRIAFRVSGLFDQRDSYYREGVTQPVLPIPLPDQDSFPLPRYTDDISVRGTLLVQPTDSLDIVVTVDHADFGGGRYDYVSQRNFFDFAIQPSPPFPPGTEDGTRPTYVDRGANAQLTMPFAFPFELDRDDKQTGVRTEVRWRPGDVEITYLGSARTFSRRGVTAFALFDVPLLGRPKDDFDQSSHELRLSYELEDRLSVQGGLYNFREKNSTAGSTEFGPLSPFVGPVFGVFTPTQTLERLLVRTTRSNSWAFFAQGTYTLVDKLRLTFGARWTHDSKTREGYDESRAGPVYNPATDVRLLDKGRANFERVTWRAGLDYDIGASTMVYGAVATGFKAGGFNDGCLEGAIGEDGLACTNPANPDNFFYEPETVTSFEAGVKAFVPTIGLGIQVAAFHYIYDNLQLLRVTQDLRSTAVFENAANARNTGLEVEGNMRVGERTDFIGSFTWLHTELGDYTPLGPSGPNFKGRPLERSPEVTASLRVRHTIPVGFGNIVLGAGTRFSGSYYLYDYSTGTIFRQPSFFKSDALVELASRDGGLTVGAFINNIEDNVEVNGIQAGNAIPGIGVIPGYAAAGQPRTWGVRLGYRF
jgi:iron complex outermembrane receptor protein